MWDETTGPAPASSGSSILDTITGIFDAGVSRVGQEVQRKISGDTFDQTDAKLGVNERGQVYAAGKPTFTGGTIAGVPAPFVLVGVGILALAIILHSKG